MAIQVYLTTEPMERTHQVLLGTDNLDISGVVVDPNQKCTTYKRVLCRRKPVQSIHLNLTAAQRQFTTHQVGCNEAEVPQDPCYDAVPGDKGEETKG